MSGRATGAVALVDMSRQVVCRSEVLAAASLQMHAQNVHGLAALGSWSVIRSEQDATNSGIWRKNKLMNFYRETTTVDQHGLSVMQSLMQDKLDPAYWFKPAVETNNLTGDLMVVSEGTAAAAAALFEKQMQSSGCQSITESVQRLTSCCADNFTAIMMASDGGPDQTRQKKHWQHAAHGAMSLFVFDLRCWFHLYSRQSEGHLRKVEEGVVNFPGDALSWKYYASLCKICQCSRDLASEMYTRWGILFGVEAQQKKARTFVPRPVASRWQSVFTCEEHLCNVNKDNQFSRTLQECLVNKKMNEKVNVKQVNKVQGFDELAAEEIHAYAEKMGRWRRDTLNTIRDPIFWIIMEVSSKVRSPAEHLACWLKGSAICKDSPWLTGLHHCQFMFFKGDQLAAEYVELLRLDWLADRFLGLPDAVVQWLTDFAIDLILWNYSDFKRRFIEGTRHFPDKLLWFVHSLHDSPCTHRQRVATEMTQMNGLDANARKILQAFGGDVENARKTGLCSFRLWVFLYTIGSQWRNRSDRIEGLNSFIKRETKAAPRINLDLLSSRLRLQCRIGTLDRKQEFTWRSGHKQMSKVLQDIMESMDDAEAHMRHNGDDRWTEVEPLKLQGMTAAQSLQVCGPSLSAAIGESMHDIGDVPARELDFCSKWAKKMANNIRDQLRNTLLKLGKGTFPCSLCINIGEHDGECYLPAHLGSMLFIKCSYPTISMGSLPNTGCGLVRFDLVIRTLYSQVMTSVELGKQSPKRGRHSMQQPPLLSSGFAGHRVWAM